MQYAVCSMQCVVWIIKYNMHYGVCVCVWYAIVVDGVKSWRIIYYRHAIKYMTRPARQHGSTRTPPDECHAASGAAVD